MAGNALQRMFAYTHPHVRHSIAFSLEQPAEEKGKEVSGLPHGQVAHLLRQTARISQGENPDFLTALRPDPDLHNPSANTGSTNTDPPTWKLRVPTCTNPFFK